MEKIELTKRDFVFLGIISLVAVAFTVVWMALTGNAPQVYNDIVIEWTAWVRSNKRSEILLLRLLILLGAVSVFLWCKFCRKHFLPTNTIVTEKKADAAKYLVVWICSIVVLKFLFFQQVSQLFVFALCFAGIVFIIEKNAVISSLCMYFLSYYALFAIYHTCNFLGSYRIIKAFSEMKNYPSALAVIFAILCTGIPLFFKKRSLILKSAILLIQLVLPALFLILSIKEYNFNGEIVNIGIPFRAKVIVAIAVLFTFADAVRVLKNSWRKEDFEISDLISLGTCVSLMCFNFYGGQGAVVSADLHHPFENVFAFQQFFELGQIPFKDFIPPSGLFSVVHGFFFKLCGQGNIAYMSLSDNIFFFSIFALMLFLLQFHLKKIWCLAVALFLQFPYYNRVLFMTIVVLLLLLPQLVRRANLWLKVFLLVNVFHGLYYPVYGVACFVGFLPMFVIQCRKLFLSEKKSFKTGGFWIGWIPVFVLLLASVPLLWGTLIHIKAMAGQSVLADGISIFGQELPGWFMPYAKNIFRYPLYNAMHILPLALIVWLPVLFLCRFLTHVDMCQERAWTRQTVLQFMDEHIEILTAVISLILIPLVSYSYSFIRVDMFSFFARSWSALICVFVLYTVFVTKYVKNNSFKLIALFLLNLLIVPSRGVGVENIEWKMFSKFGVSGDFQLVKKGDFGFSTVGKCFLRNDYLNSLNWEKNKLSEVNGESSFAKIGSFGHWYIFKQKGGANIEGSIMKSFSAAKETCKNLLKNKTLVGTYIDPNCLYYFYNWLVSSGDYVWDSSRNSFVPNESISDFGEIKKLNLENPFCRGDYDLGNSADVFGLSFRFLRKIFTEKKIDFESRSENKEIVLEFNDYIHGKDMDFVYFEFSEIENECIVTEFNMGGEHEKNQSNLISKLFLKKKQNPSMQVFVYFYDENGKRHCVKANYGNGKLLMNLGVGARWLFDKHGKLEIEVQKSGVMVDIPELKEIKFLKCQQIFQDKFDYLNAVVYYDDDSDFEMNELFE